MSTHVDLLVFGAHPDDAEIGMGGTIAKYAAIGKKIAVCDFTRAEMSSNGDPELRSQEAAAADSILGVHTRINLGLPDRGLFLSKEAVDLAVVQIRTLKPSIVCVPYWQDRHPDHVACSNIMEQALFNARLRKYMPELPAHTSISYYYFINDVFEASFAVDVTNVHSAKMAALSAYRSQFELRSPEDVATPINQGYLTRVSARDHLLGQKTGVMYAEGFVTKQVLKLDFFM